MVAFHGSSKSLESFWYFSIILLKENLEIFVLPVILPKRFRMNHIYYFAPCFFIFVIAQNKFLCKTIFLLSCFGPLFIGFVMKWIITEFIFGSLVITCLFCGSLGHEWEVAMGERSSKLWRILRGEYSDEWYDSIKLSNQRQFLLCEILDTRTIMITQEEKGTDVVKGQNMMN